jgi:cyclic pyranopterin phosphate synthase
MPAEGEARRDHDEVLRFEQIVRLVRAIRAGPGLTKVHLTGGEPLVRRGIVDLVAMLSAEGAGDLAMTTNGQDLAGMAEPLRRAGLRRVNISLDTLRPDQFESLTRGGRLGRALAGLDAALEAGLAPVKLNTAVIRGVNDDEVVEIARFALDRGCPVRFLELMPIGPAAARSAAWFVSSDEVRRRLARAFDLRPMDVSPGGSARYVAATDAEGRSGRIGFISSRTEPFCRDCRRLRLTATGALIGCLAVGAGADVRAFLADGDTDTAALLRVVEEVLGTKRADEAFTTAGTMSSIGG